MKKIKTRHIIFLFTTFLIPILFTLVHIWNDNPPLPKRSNPEILKLDVLTTTSNQNLKIASYNIHFGIGFDVTTIKTKKEDYIRRLDEIASILKKIDADIVLLQEVDFDSKRSSFIHQGKYLAQKAGYSYVAKSATLRKKFHLSFNLLWGRIEHGLCILSKYPVESNESIVFEQTKEVPIIAKWLFDPHGSQRCIIDYKGTKINVVNLHLDPWSQQTREKQILEIKNEFLENSKLPSIIGGDFNSLSPKSKKEGLYMQDAPWFIDKTKWNIEKESTIPTLLHAGFIEADPTILKFARKKNYTFPSDNPKEKIDYIFAGNRAKILDGFVYKNAKEASDHLPIAAEITILSN